MPKLTGIFEDLTGLDSLSIIEVNRFLTDKEHVYVLENYLGNRILYPQTVPIGKRDMEIDLAILCAYMHTHQELFHIAGLKRIMIPEKIELRFPPLANLIFYFPEIFNLSEVEELAIKKESSQVMVAGTIITPRTKNSEIAKLSEIKINGQTVKLDPHGMTYFDSNKNSNEIELPTKTLTVSGGKIGLIINQKHPDQT